MPFYEVFDLFWKEVIKSVEEGIFAKLTMAKTIGRPNLRNIFLRPIYSEDGFKVLLKFRYRSPETEDQEDELTLEEAYVIVRSHLKKSFSSVLLFTTTKDVSFKINKNDAGRVTEGLPTFRSI